MTMNNLFYEKLPNYVLIAIALKLMKFHMCICKSTGYLNGRPY